MAQERTAPAEYHNEFDPAALVEQIKKGALKDDPFISEEAKERETA